MRIYLDSNRITTLVRAKEGGKFRMKRLVGLATLAVALGTAPVVNGQKDHRPETDDEVVRFVIDTDRQWLEANMTQDSSILERILADDYQNMRPTGRFSTKADEIAMVKMKRSCKLRSDHLDDAKVRVFGDVAVSYGWETFVVECPDKVKTGHYFWNDVWLKRDGRWQMVAGAEPPPTAVSPLLPPEPTPAQSTSAAIPDAMSSYDFVLGKWRCEGLTPEGKVDYTFTQENSKILSEHWFKLHSEHDDAFMTYDTDGHLWRYLSMDDSGGYSIGRSPGWTGNTQTWTGYSYKNGARRSWGRIRFTKVSDHEKREDFYAPVKNGSTGFVGSEVCTKID